MSNIPPWFIEGSDSLEVGESVLPVGRHTVPFRLPESEGGDPAGWWVAMSTIKINVTQEHIDNGCRYSASCCPVANALEDAFTPPLYMAQVDGTNALLHFTSERRQRVRLPGAAQLWVMDFDKGEPVAPFAFDIALE